jgi:alpha-L-fucosidase
MELYYSSVGRNSNLLLNIPPDRRGLLNESDVKSLMGFRQLREKEFSKDLAKGKSAQSTAYRGRNFIASFVDDGDPETYWATSDDVKSASVTINLGERTEVNRILIQEYIKLGQRVSKFSVYAMVDDKWEKVAEGTTIGHKIIRKFPVVLTTDIRLTIDDARACPAISNIELYRAPGN